MTSLEAHPSEQRVKDTIAFVRIEPHMIDTVWERCKDYLAQSISKNAPAFDVQDIYSNLLTNECQLWVAVGGGRIMAAATTIITAEPKAKTLAILNLGGEELRSWVKPMDEAFTAFAIENGCQYIEAVTRKGFHRFVPEFIEDGIVFIKRVGTIQ